MSGTLQAILTLILVCAAVSLVLWMIYDRRRLEAIGRESAADALKRSDGRFRSLFHNVLEGVYQSTPGGKLLTVNPALVAMFGYGSEEEFLKVNITRDLYIDSEDRNKHLQFLNRNGEMRSAELRLRRKDGSTLVVLENSRAVRDENGNLLYYEGTLTDITEQRRVQRRERDSNAALELLARNEKAETILDAVLTMIENQFPEAMTAIDLLEEGRLYCIVCRGMPAGFSAAMDAIPAGPAAACAGTAAHAGRFTVCPDISSDPLWIDYRAIAANYQIRSACSAPVILSSGRVVGTLTLYSRETGARNREIVTLMERASQLAAIAIDRRQLTELLTFQAQHDAVTRLPNRFLFTDRLEQALLNAKRNQKGVALLYIDLDDFKTINDTLGHAAGDKLLCEVAERFLKSVRGNDTVARTGGDEFTAIVQDLDQIEAAHQVAEKLLRSLRHPFEIEGQELQVSASIGISVFPYDGEEAESLQQHADRAMYRAKKNGKNAVELFDGSSLQRDLSQTAVADAIIRKLNKIEIVLTSRKRDRQLQ